MQVSLELNSHPQSAFLFLWQVRKTSAVVSVSEHKLDCVLLDSLTKCSLISMVITANNAGLS